MIKANTFKTQPELLAWLQRNAAPMIDENGAVLPHTGIARIRLAQPMIKLLLEGGAQGRDTGKDTVYNFVREGKRYTLKVEITWNATADCVFTWDHRDGNLALKDTEEIEPVFQITLRDYTNRVWMEDGSWMMVNTLRNASKVVAWEIRRWIGGRHVVIAQSTSYHPAVIPFMQNANKKLGQSVVDGLLVDEQLERTYIYFTDTVQKFGSCIKIYNGTHISIEGGVTLDNYDGFIKAAALAKQYLRPTS